jgi:hypothetical protein|tara:strand:+ start:177 stop:413 length:237 start_codon:yes stop_codon:yes gene_type:complete
MSSFFKGIFTGDFGQASRQNAAKIPKNIKSIPRLQPRRRQGGRYVLAIVLGVSIGVYAFEPLFREIGEKQKKGELTKT